MVGIRISKSKIVRKNNENHKQERVDQAKAVETKKNIFRSHRTNQVFTIFHDLTCGSENLIYLLCMYLTYLCVEYVNFNTLEKVRHLPEQPQKRCQIRKINISL